MLVLLLQKTDKGVVVLYRIAILSISILAATVIQLEADADLSFGMLTKCCNDGACQFCEDIGRSVYLRLGDCGNRK